MRPRITAPSIMSRTLRHLHGTNFEEIQRIHRRPGHSHYLMRHLASRECDTLSVIDAARQDDFYSPIIEVRSFYEAYPREISVNESWNDCQATFGYQLETLPSHGTKAEVCPHWLPNGSTATEALQLECNAKDFTSVVSYYFKASA